MAEPNYVQSLNDRQREAVLHTEGPLIVLAGAGSGKTKMLTSRIAYLMDEKKVPPYNIMAVTFTNKAAAEMKERVEKALHHSDSFYAMPEIGTFHSVCVRILRREMDRLPFNKPFVIYDDSDQLSLIKNIFNRLSIEEKSVSAKGIQGSINRLKCDALEPDDVKPQAHNLFQKKLAEVYREYQKELFANNALDFGEILCMVYRLFRDHADIREKYQNRYKYIHVDEYQDTNRAQYLLLSMLADPKNGGHKNICVVGDEDQSIYKWRGADIRNILDFETDYPGSYVVKLEQNYRSTKNIITAASSLIKNNTSRKDKTLWTDNEEGSLIVHSPVLDERVEAEVVVEDIKKIASNDGRAYSDFAIFYRTNAQSRQFEDVLRRDKIPYQILGGLRFYDRKEIKDVLSYFKVLQNPADSVSLRRIINVPARGIGKTTIERLDVIHGEAAGTKNFFEVVEMASQDPSLTSPSTSKKLRVFVEIIHKLQDEQPKILLSELYHLLLDETGYVRELKAEATEESLARIENLEEFDTLLQEFEEDQLENLSEDELKAKKKELLFNFLEQTSLVSDVDNLDQNASTVKLMTLHSSKGLEFPVVFVVGMEEGLFPSIKAWEETPEEDIEEERRLCYVGMTRAREHLFLLNANVRRIWGQTNYQEPSRFLSEVPLPLMQTRKPSSMLKPTFRLGSSKSFIQQEPVRSYSTGAVVSGLVGKSFNHPEYGSGRVLASEGMGEDQKITVEFSGKRQKKFLMRYVSEFISQ
jgi:DNA helicase II / ATP-dependent DNA helicase PcrA